MGGKYLKPFAAGAWFALAVLACSSKKPSGAEGDSGPLIHCCEDAGASPDAGADAHSVSKRDAGPEGRIDASGGRVDGGCVACEHARDWSTYPAIAQVDGVSELWVVSDIHGDYTAALTLLAAGAIIQGTPTSPGAVKWGAGTATLVVVGDLIDKGPDAPDLIEMLIALQTSASSAGGRVIVTMGNHEAEFLANAEDTSAIKSNGFDPELTAVGLSPDATAGGAGPIGVFLRNLPFAARVDDWFFVHAGDTGGESLAQLSNDLESGVDSMGFGAPILAGTSSLLEARLNGSPPQWWDATGDATTLLTAWTAALSAKHLVMGHQPGAVGISSGPDRSKDQMAAEYGGLLFLIDTGLSVDVDDTGGALLHVTNVGQPSVAWEEVLPTGATKSL